MSWAILNRGREDWWTSSGADGWATCIVIGILLGFYAVRLLLRPFGCLHPQKSESKASLSRSSGYGDAVNAGPPIVTEADLQKLLLLLNESGHSDGLPWIPVVDKQSKTLSYQAKLREPEDGSPTEYLSTSLFRNCTCKRLKDFYMDNEYRLRWDKTFESYELLHDDEKTAFEIGRFIRQFPFIRPREYVLAWRLWEGEDGSFYYFAKHCEHPQAPQVALYTRVEHYLSGWRIRRDGDHCEIKMWHQEDTTPMAKMAFSYRIWNYMCEMEKSLRRYKHAQHDGTKDAAPQIPKVPVALLKSISCPAEFQPSLESNLTGGFFKKRKLSIRQSGKWMANSILVLGGAMFCARRSAPLGAKIAAVYAIKKLVKPSTTSGRPIRQHYRVL
eukprot:c20319_g1_i1 orf=965-2122(+)